MSTPRLKMIFFTSKDCSVCSDVKKRVLPVFQKAHPELKIEEVKIGLDAPSDNTTAEARADAYGIRGVPAIFFELEGLPQGSGVDCTLPGLNKLLRDAEGALKKAAT